MPGLQDGWSYSPGSFSKKELEKITSPVQPSFLPLENEEFLPVLAISDSVTFRELNQIPGTAFCKAAFDLSICDAKYKVPTAFLSPLMAPLTEPR